MTFSTFIVILVGLVELIRALWMWTLLGEATRRAARVAVVCDINDPAIYRTATELPGVRLTPANLAVSYHYCVADAPMSTRCDQFRMASWHWDEAPSADQTAEIRGSPQIFVQVGIKDFKPLFAFLFPWDTRDDQGRAILTPTDDFLRRYFLTSLPAESLGWNPAGGADQRGAFQPCP